MQISFTVPNAVALRAVQNFPAHTKEVEVTPAEYDGEGNLITPAEYETQIVKSAKQVAYASLQAHIREWFRQQAGGAILAAQGKTDVDAEIGALVKEHRTIDTLNVEVTDE